MLAKALTCPHDFCVSAVGLAWQPIHPDVDVLKKKQRAMSLWGAVQ